jgi:hypothetical protein
MTKMIDVLVEDCDGCPASKERPYIRDDGRVEPLRLYCWRLKTYIPDGQEYEIYKDCNLDDAA